MTPGWGRSTAAPAGSDRPRRTARPRNPPPGPWAVFVLAAVAVALAHVAILLGTPTWWLLLLAPVLGLLYRAYRDHRRAEDDRHSLLALPRVTRTLSGSSRRDVATAGVHGALDVFDALRAEVQVVYADGTHRRWAGDPSGPVVEIAASTAGTPVGDAGSPIVRAMTVSGEPMGELLVWRAGGIADEAALGAYADALADALHAATTTERLALRDPLTGLPNRAGLVTDGDRLLRSLDRLHPIALLMIDLDDFKQVNDVLGQDAGDELLKVVGQRLADLARRNDLLARLGDDEFALLLPQPALLSDSSAPLNGGSPAQQQTLRRARELVPQPAIPMDIAGISLATEAAVGVVLAGAGCYDMAELIRRAEIALDEAKRFETSVTAYDDTQDISSTDHLALLAELRVALDADDQIVLALQPAVDLETGRPTGVEALSRWKHPRRGHLPPIDFIRVVEHSELLGPFTRYVLHHSLAAAATWSAAGLDLPVSVNVAARSLLDPSFPGQVAEALRRHGLPPHQLVLEITETVAVSEQPIVDEVVSALRDVGVQLSVDDFGTGYSSLAFLDRMPVDELKVDRSFVAGMADSARSAAIVRFAVELGRSLNLRVVAEGVETADQRAALIALGCTSAQGYHFCQPLPADKIVEALRALVDAAPPNIVPLRADGAS